jgi:hypothetical protein
MRWVLILSFAILSCLVAFHFIPSVAGTWFHLPVVGLPISGTLLVFIGAIVLALRAK